MANRNFAPPLGYLDRKVVVLAGSISIAADASVATTSITGVATAARTAAGRYLVTLSDSYPSLLSALVTLEAPVAVDLVPQVRGVPDVLTAKTITISTLTGGVETDAAAVCVLYVVLFLKNTSV